MTITRQWAMPNHDTFRVKPIGEFVMKYIANSAVSVDPFARNNQWATHRNDINPSTLAENHIDAVDYLNQLAEAGLQADLIILDPPYSPRQISECYKEIGRPVAMADTQNAAFYKRVKDAADKVAAPGAFVLCFGWNSSGMGEKRGYKVIEIQLVCHGAAHNDTICIAEQKS